MTARAPLGAPAVWLAVVDRDGGRCTCTGGCGRRHRDPAAPGSAGRRGPGANAIPTVVERCPAGSGPVVVDLHVVPADPTIPQASGWNLPVTALTTRCPDCATRSVRRAAAAARSAQDETPAAQAGPVDLFDLLALDDPTSSSSSGGACSVAVPATESADPSVCPGSVRDVL